MAANRGDRVKVTISTAGSGSPFTMTGAVSTAFQTLAAAGFSDGDIVEYFIEDGTTAFEVGWGVLGSTQTTCTRNVRFSSNANAAVNLSGSATAGFNINTMGFAPFAFMAHRAGGGI